ncbi:MAG TPA: glycoside hydrolase domain-containing protein [Actinomycetota bacterium]|nr:glycoside hydrolase domain-containing protein [Actinomycetota bacterium]
MKVVVRLGVAGLLAVALIPAPSRASTVTGPSVTVVGSAVKVRPTDQVGGTGGANVTAARNEYESFQVVVSAGTGPVTALRVSLASPLSGTGGTIPAGNVTIYREAYYDVTTVSDSEGALGRWPDALIPTVDPYFHETRNAFPIDVPAGENRVAWVDVLVPQAQAAGAYDGSLAVTATGFSATVPVHLTVIDFGIPSTASLASAFGMDWDTPCQAFYGESCITHEADGWRTKAMFVQAALDDRITIGYPEYQPITPPQERAYFEQYILPMLNGTAPTTLPGAELTSIQVDNGTWLPGWRDEANAQGFADRAFVYACDEPNTSAGAWRSCIKQANLALSTWPQVSILITTTIDNADRFGATSLIDTMVPIVNEVHDKPGTGSGYSGNQRPNYDGFLTDPRNRLWMYTSCETEGCAGDPSTDPYWVGWPGYPIDEPASEARAMGWLSFLYRTAGELYYATDYKLSTAWTDQFAFGGNGDGTLFYPGTPAMVGGTDPIPIESMRLKLIRDGYEDYEYLKYLGDHGLRAQALAVVKGLFPKMYRTAATDAQVQAARLQLADLVASVAGEATARSEPPAADPRRTA